MAEKKKAAPAAPKAEERTVAAEATAAEPASLMPSLAPSTEASRDFFNGAYPVGTQMPMTCGICQKYWPRMTPPPCQHTQAELDNWTQANPGKSRWIPTPPSP